MTEYVEHAIYFELSMDVSINVLYKIALEFERSPEAVADANGIGFILRLEEDEAKYLHEQYGRYIDTICDEDQERGGSFI